MMQTATNPDTGERAVLLGDKWEKIEQSATNDKGQKAYLVKGQWVVDDTPKEPVQTTKPVEEKQPAPVSATGVVQEGLKGVVRGASSTASSIPESVFKPAEGTAKTAATITDLITGNNVASTAVNSISNKIREIFQEAQKVTGRAQLKASPANEAERFAGTTGEILGSSVGTPVKAAIAPAVLGAAGEQVGGEAGKIAGILAPGVTSMAKSALLSKQDTVAKNLANAEQAGAGTLSVGQATESKWISGLENLMSKIPGSQDIFNRLVKRQQSGMENTARQGVAAEDAGFAIERGVRGAGGYMDRSKEAFNKLDDVLAGKVKSKAGEWAVNESGRLVVRVPVNNTASQLDDLVNQAMNDLPNTRGAVSSEKIQTIAEGFKKDILANNGAVSYESLRQFRTNVGQLLDDALISGVDNAALKQLYKAITADIKVAAEKSGALAEFNRANKFWNDRQDRLEIISKVLGDAREPAKIFDRLMPNTAAENKFLRRTIMAMDDEVRTVFGKAAAERLGLKNRTEEWSSATFLTNWQKLSEEAKALVFKDRGMRSDMDAIAKTASTIKEGASSLANPSGSAGAGFAYAMISALVGGAAAGATPVVAGVAGLAVGSAAISKYLLTNPKFVKWLAEAEKVPSKNIAGHFARLNTIFNDIKDPQEKEAMAQYINNVNEAMNGN